MQLAAYIIKGRSGVHRSEFVGVHVTSVLWNDHLMWTLIDMLIAYQLKFGRDQPFSWVDHTSKFEEVTNKICCKETLKKTNIVG